jgi:hypothetical protein
MFALALDLWIAFLIAYFARRWAGWLGLAAGAGIAALIVVGLGVAWQMHPLAVLHLYGGELYIRSHALACGLFAVVFRGFLTGRIQRWWRLL